MKTCHRLLRLVDRLSETIRTVQERIRHAVATEIGQAVGQTAQDLLHALLRGGEPRYEPEPHRREFDGDIDSVAVDPHDPDLDRPPAVEAVDPPRSPRAGRPSRVPWLGLGLGLATGLATWWNPMATAGFLAVATEWIALARWAHSPL